LDLYVVSLTRRFGALIRFWRGRAREIEIVCHVWDKPDDKETNLSLAVPADRKLFALDGDHFVCGPMLPMYRSVDTRGRNELTWVILPS
jgi:hypothetical protein